MEDNKLNYIDLFSGCGGLSLGLYNSGWRGLFAVEKNKDAFSTLQYNLINKRKHFHWPDWFPIINHDIREVLNHYQEQLDDLKNKVTLIVGGPPCQGFSMAGRRNQEDERNTLVDSYIDFIDTVRPKLLLFENVKGFTIEFGKDNLEGESISYSIYVKNRLESIGYNVRGEVLDFSEFGIPQRRKRFILIGCLENDPALFFKLIKENACEFLKEKKLKRNVTIEDAISDLLKSHGTVPSPDSSKFKAGIYGDAVGSYQRYLRRGGRYKGRVADSHRFANHQEDTIKMFQNVIDHAPKNRRLDGDLKKKFNLKRRGVFLLDKDLVCPTLTTNPDDYIHYSEPRILTVREYARIQSFPDWYEFKGKYTTGGELRVMEVPRYTQLGNAIPPIFGEQAGRVLKEMI